MYPFNPSRSFASDNNSGAHPEILRAISEANQGHAIAYGDDFYTESAKLKLKEHFGGSCEPYFVFNGTAANVLGLKALTESFHCILCMQIAHIAVDECGAPEKFTGCKLELVPPNSQGKLTLEAIKNQIRGLGDQHHVQAKVISISQSTELGTVYTPDEIQAISDFAHKNGMYLHMDGARLSNAAASLGVGLRKITVDAGVDVLSFGGTKNGLLFGEAILFFNQEISKNFKFIRKQGMQLASKMRFIAAQFEALLSNDLWLKNASHANRMARLLADEVKKIPQIQITRPVQGNAIFATLPVQWIPQIQKKYFFYIWDEKISEVRWMTSFDTSQEDISDFVKTIKKLN